MIIEVSIIENDGWYDIQVWNVEKQEREEDLEAGFQTEKEADEYVSNLSKDKRYNVTHVDL